jgi:N-acetylmuramoyl-L-alanine amidase
MKQIVNNMRLKYFFYYPVLILTAVFMLYSCSPKPYTSSNKTYKKKAKEFAKVISSKPALINNDSLQLDASWIGTTNFGMRKPNFVILHHTAQNSCEQTLRTFTLDSTKVSAHYVICKDGNIHHMLNDYLRAWHAGLAKWGNLTDVNSASIGIEIDNNGVDSFTEAQLHSLFNLLATLKKNYHIPAANFIGHADVAPGRKTDPGITFPWKRLAETGYGLWFSDTTNLQLPEYFNVNQALKIIGYDITNPASTIQVFRQHYLQSVATGELVEAEKKVLYGLMLKCL